MFLWLTLIWPIWGNDLLDEISQFCQEFGVVDTDWSLFANQETLPQTEEPLDVPSQPLQPVPEQQLEKQNIWYFLYIYTIEIRNKS